MDNYKIVDINNENIYQCLFCNFNTKYLNSIKRHFDRLKICNLHTLNILLVMG